MKISTLALLLIFTLGSSLFARTWTDKDGRALEADILSATETDVTINMKGKEFKLPLEKLSDADQAYVKEWLAEEEKKKEEKEKKEAEAKAALPPGQALFDGKPLLLGGKTNVFEYEYSAEQLALVKKEKGTDTGYKIALALPADFDPAKPQKVFVVNTAVNNEKQGKEGNVFMMGFFGKQCVSSGWICMAFDSSVGRPNHDIDMIAAFDKLKTVWPEFKNWNFAVGGFSGGAKACFFPCGYLLKNDYKVVGAFLAGCNEDYSGAAQAKYKVPKGDFKDIKVFLGNPNYKAEYAELIMGSLKKNGLSNIRAEVHNGKNSLDYTQFAEGLKWFAGQ